MDTVFSEDYLIQSSDYVKVMNDTVIPWLQSREKSRIISGFDGNPLYCVSYDADNSRGTVFIIHGFTENAFKYSELIWALLHLQYSVVAYDQRGHGRSFRCPGLPDMSVTHVDHFSDYVKDFRIIFEEYRTVMPRPFLCFAHSMGGAVAVLYLEQYPDDFSAVVLSSPMIAPNLGGIPARFALALAKVAGILGKQKSNPFFMKRYDGPEDFASSCATDPGRFAWYDAVKASRKEFQNSIPSYRWSEESIRVSEAILMPGQPERISCPVLLFSASEDNTVLHQPQLSLVSRIQGGTEMMVEDAKHEIYRSKNDVLFPWWHQVIAFFNESVNSDTAEGVY